MVLWLIAIAALGTAIYFRVYQQPWLYSALGISHRRWDDDFYGGPPLVVHKRHPLHVPTDPALERVRAATERVDTQRYESLSQALQVVHHARDNFPPGAPVILLPLLLGIILKWCCRRKEGRPISPSSFCSETSRHGHLTPIEQLDDWLSENRELGHPTRHIHRIRRRRFSQQPLVVDFPVLSNNAEASTAESHGSHRAQEVTTADTIQQWLRGMALPFEHRTRRLTDFLSVRASDVLGLRAGREVPRRSRGKWCCTAADTVRGTDGNGIRSDFVERLQDCAGSARKDGTEETAVFGDYDDEGKPLLELSDDPSDCEGSDGEERRSGGGDADHSDINTSGLSEETSYMELPKSELSSATPSTCSLEVPTQDAWFSVAATLDPLVAAPASRPSPVQQPRNVFEQLLEACGQQEPASFSAVLAELGVQNCVKLHESEHADIFLVYSERGDTMVLKVYDCAYIMQHLCCIINEIRIARSLTTLANGVENQTGGFPQVHM
ncbi:uncharacterized protein LOC142772074 [Rhipicephalus microplus]|uniref:uncharacterized protein LOC142772074 n=1 Tax=Rhipicephalus microplus TaxID=6941 RepID=UPI003F6AF9E5